MKDNMIVAKFMQTIKGIAKELALVKTLIEGHDLVIVIVLNGLREESNNKCFRLN